MHPKDKRTLRIELTNLQARFVLLAEHNTQALKILGEMRRILPEQRAEIAALKKENAELKDAMRLVPPTPEAPDGASVVEDTCET
jgi:uncharacterized protein YdcH (DUF465 family)